MGQEELVARLIDHIRTAVAGEVVCYGLLDGLHNDTSYLLGGGCLLRGFVRVGLQLA